MIEGTILSLVKSVGFLTSEPDNPIGLIILDAEAFVTSGRLTFPFPLRIVSTLEAKRKFMKEHRSVFVHFKLDNPIGLIILDAEMFRFPFDFSHGNLIRIAYRALSIAFGAQAG